MNRKKAMLASVVSTFGWFMSGYSIWYLLDAMEIYKSPIAIIFMLFFGVIMIMIADTAGNDITKKINKG